MSSRQSGIVALVSMYRCGWLDNRKDHRTNIIHTVIQNGASQCRRQVSLEQFLSARSETLEITSLLQESNVYHYDFLYLVGNS